MWCPNNIHQSDVTDQYQCQSLCKPNTGCVGIAYSHKEEITHHCYLCNDDLVEPSDNDFGFYRNIEKGKKVVS